LPLDTNELVVAPAMPSHLEQVEGVDVEIIEPVPDAYSRSPGDKLRVAVALGTFVLTLLAAAVFRSLIEGAENDVKDLANRVSGLQNFLLGLDGTIAVLSTVGLVVTLVVLRRVRVTIMVLIAALCSYLLMDVLAVALNGFKLPGVEVQVRFISEKGPHFIAMGAAVVTVLGPWFPRWVRRVGVATVAFVALTRMSPIGTNTPYDVAMSTMLGWLVGTLSVMVFGSPNRQPSGRAIAEALVGVGLAIDRLELKGRGVRGSSVYLANTPDGRRHFVKVSSTDQRDADALLQVVRWVRLREASGTRPFSSLRRAVEHEALISLKAHDDGVPTAKMLAVAEVEPDGMLLAFDYLGGESLAGGGERIADSMLREVWRVAAALRRHRIAHRDLRLDHFIVGTDGLPRVVDLGSGELAASTTDLNSDVAELLCSVAIEVGAERAVATAKEVMGTETLGSMVPRLQPLALSVETRRQLREHDGLLDELRTQVQLAAGLDDVRYEELARIKPRTIGIIVVFTIALYALLPQLATVNELGDKIRTANFWWVAPMLVCVVITWSGATMGLMGSVPDRLPFLTMFSAQVSSSFLDTWAPAGLGGMALNTRLMQKRGVEPARAVAGVGVNAVAGFIMHLVLLGVFLLWASATGAPTGAPADAAEPGATGGLPPSLLILGAIVVLVLISFALPPTRKFIFTKGVPMARDAGSGLVELARRPRKLAALFGGSTIVTLGLYTALLCSVQAFGGTLTPAQVGAAYMVAFSVSVFSPTPGGLGVLELSLGAAFNSLGMERDAAFASVALFRLITFFLPIIPGWITFTIIQRRGLV